MSAALAPLLVMATVTVMATVMVMVMVMVMMMLSCHSKQQRRLRSLQHSWESWRTDGSLQNQDEVQ